jgi:pterin-4a-carbinolamine dehydratase/uncharacterized protein (DUF2267 family)
MATYEELIDAVRARLADDDIERARAAVARAVGGLVHWLPEPERYALRDALPAPLRPADLEDVRPRTGAATAFVAFVAGREGREPEVVRYEVQAVLSALSAVEPETAERLRRALPGEFAELFRAPGDGPPPDLAAGAGVPPAELTEEDVRALLRRLPEWTGDRHRLSRPVAPPDYLAEQLFTRIRDLEQRLDHRAVVEAEPDGSYRIDVWTHSEGLVTDLDAQFAQELERVVAEVLDERPPVRSQPPPEREIVPPRPASGPVPGTSHRRKRER